MRQIKFRAWDEVCECYLENSFEVHSIGCVSHQGAWVTGQVVLEQYTGLHDANGVEIYEGDVVASRHITKPGAAITYQERYAGFCIGPDWPLSEYYDYTNKGLNLEVIGNIHENPELLEPKE